MRVVDIDVVLSLVDVGCLFKGIGSFHQIVIPEGEGVFRNFAIQQILIAGVGGHEDLSVQHGGGEADEPVSLPRPHCAHGSLVLVRVVDLDVLEHVSEGLRHALGLHIPLLVVLAGCIVTAVRVPFIVGEVALNLVLAAVYGIRPVGQVAYEYVVRQCLQLIDELLDVLVQYKVVVVAFGVVLEVECGVEHDDNLMVFLYLILLL